MKIVALDKHSPHPFLKNNRQTAPPGKMTFADLLSTIDDRLFMEANMNEEQVEHSGGPGEQIIRQPVGRSGEAQTMPANSVRTEGHTLSNRGKDEQVTGRGPEWSSRIAEQLFYWLFTTATGDDPDIFHRAATPGKIGVEPFSSGKGQVSANRKAEVETSLHEVAARSFTPERIRASFLLSAVQNVAAESLNDGRISSLPVGKQFASLSEAFLSQGLNNEWGIDSALLRTMMDSAVSHTGNGSLRFRESNGHGWALLMDDLSQKFPDLKARLLTLQEVFTRLMAEVEGTRGRQELSELFQALNKGQALNPGKETTPILQTGTHHPLNNGTRLQWGEAYEGERSVQSANTDGSGLAKGNTDPTVAEKQRASGDALIISRHNPINTGIHQPVLSGTATSENGEKPLTFSRFIEQFQSLLQKANFARNGLTQRLTVRLYPEKLGTLKIQLVKHHGELIARIVSSSKQTKELLESHIATLRNAFIQNNIPIQRIAIENLWQLDESFLPRDGKGEEQQGSRDGSRDRGKKEKNDQVQTSFEQLLVNYEV